MIENLPIAINFLLVNTQLFKEKSEKISKDKLISQFDKNIFIPIALNKLVIQKPCKIESFKVIKKLIVVRQIYIEKEIDVLKPAMCLMFESLIRLS